MIVALFERPAFAMCMGCPVPKEVQDSYCNKWRGEIGLEYGNLCLLMEISRRVGTRYIRIPVQKVGPSVETRLLHHTDKPVVVVPHLVVRPVIVKAKGV